ncbi:MAG: hypothetical protein A4E74_01235 [Syntrophus sp. PtaB.Bin075]|nr:MAG: hypothetical protein A4E74_01235 [Syntrophus sp. PtaB.Bin075]
MARLSKGDATLEISYRDFFAGWVMYEINFLWRGENIVNEDILQRSELRENFSKGAMVASEDAECGLLPILRKVIETNQPDYWEPLEPDVILGIYPEDYFPFLESKWRLVRESEEHRRECEERALLKAEKGVLADDYITLIMFVDTYAFKGCDAYSGDGISLHLMVKRRELESFYDELKGEYLEFKKRFHVDDLNRKEKGDDWKPMEV